MFKTTRTLAMVLAATACDSYAYFATSLALVLHARDAWHASDVEAATLYGAWGAAMGVASAVLGPLIDSLGVERALIVGALASLAGRTAVATSASMRGASVALLSAQAIGAALSAPVLTIVVRRVVTADALAPTFGVYYATMNAAALAAALAADWFATSAAALSAAALASCAHTLFVGALLALLRLDAFDSTSSNDVAMTTTTMDNERATMRVDGDETTTAVELESARRAENDGERRLPTAREALVDAWRDPVAWRFVGFSLALTGARTLFRHADATLPTYLNRTLDASSSIGTNVDNRSASGGNVGEGDVRGESAPVRVRYGAVEAVNPALVIVCAPWVQRALGAFDPYWTVVAGTALSVGAPLTLAMGPASYARAVASMIVLAMGELVYSPLLYAYSMRLAPRGREGTYSTLAVASSVVVKAFVGPMSGALLERYCPAPSFASAPSSTTPVALSGADRIEQCAVLWWWVTAMAATTPLALAVAHRTLYDATVRARLAATITDDAHGE